MAGKLKLSPDAQADLREIAKWLSQPGAGAEAEKKLAAIKAGIKGLRCDPLRHPVFDVTGGRKCSTRGGYEIHYDVTQDPPGSASVGLCRGDVRQEPIPGLRDLRRVVGPSQGAPGIVGSRD